jgi:hypothetical protein
MALALGQAVFSGWFQQLLRSGLTCLLVCNRKKAILTDAVSHLDRFDFQRGE